jgi:hypothetical protein
MGSPERLIEMEDSRDENEGGDCSAINREDGSDGRVEVIEILESSADESEDDTNSNETLEARTIANSQARKKMDPNDEARLSASGGGPKINLDDCNGEANQPSVEIIDLTGESEDLDRDSGGSAKSGARVEIIDLTEEANEESSWPANEDTPSDTAEPYHDPSNGSEGKKGERKSSRTYREPNYAFCDVDTTATMSPTAGKKRPRMEDENTDPNRDDIIDDRDVQPLNNLQVLNIPSSLKGRRLDAVLAAMMEPRMSRYSCHNLIADGSVHQVVMKGNKEQEILLNRKSFRVQGGMVLRINLPERKISDGNPDEIPDKMKVDRSISSFQAAECIRNRSKPLIIVTTDASCGINTTGIVAVLRKINPGCLFDDVRVVLGHFPWDESCPGECGAVALGLEALLEETDLENFSTIIVSDCLPVFAFYDLVGKSKLRDTLLDAPKWVNTFQRFCQRVQHDVFLAKVKSNHTEISGFFDHEAADLLAAYARDPEAVQRNPGRWCSRVPALDPTSIEWLRNSGNYVPKKKKGDQKLRKERCSRRMREDLKLSWFSLAE